MVEISIQAVSPLSGTGVAAAAAAAGRRRFLRKRGGRAERTEGQRAQKGLRSRARGLAKRH